MSILNNIKKGVANSGSNKGKMLFIKADSKVRIRFLSEIEEGVEVTMHDDYDRGINAVCLSHYGEECPYCDDDALRTRQAYVWPVWEHEQKEVKLFMGFANNFNPLPSFVAMYESYGTIKDRDYVINRQGSGTNTRYSVVPMDKVKFKNKKAKPYSTKKIMGILKEAYPVDDDDLPEDQTDEDVDTDDEEESENEYSEMSPRELYRECLERGIKAKKKQKAKYYIDLLEEDDEEEEEDDWDDEDEDDEDGEW